jgi:DNA-binding NarL/FixJ family response regulator
VISTRRAAHTVVVQDRSTLYRECLQLLLSSLSGIEVTQAVVDDLALVEACRSAQPDAVVFEAGDVPWDAEGLADRVRPLTDQGVLVGTYAQDHRRRPVADDVVFVPRAASYRAIAAALRGEAVGPGPPSGPRSDRPSEMSDSLTQREFQVLALISGGMTTAQIAVRLGISPKTVENRRQSLFVKLGVQSQSHAITVAMRTGLLRSGSGSHGDR